MAVNEPRTFHPRITKMGDVGTATFYFDRLSDSLIVFYHPSMRPTVNIPVSDFEYLRVDVESEEVVGIMVEGLLAHAVYQDPRYLQFAVLAGVDAEEVAALREKTEVWFHSLDPERQRRQVIENWNRAVRIGMEINSRSA